MECRNVFAEVKYESRVSTHVGSPLYSVLYCRTRIIHKISHNYDLTLPGVKCWICEAMNDMELNYRIEEIKKKEKHHACMHACMHAGRTPQKIILYHPVLINCVWTGD